MTTETEERVDVERIRLLSSMRFTSSIQPRIRPKDRLRRTGITEDIVLKLSALRKQRTSERA